MHLGQHLIISFILMVLILAQRRIKSFANTLPKFILKRFNDQQLYQIYKCIQIFFVYNINYKQMGCGSSVAQVSDSMKDGIFKPLRLLDIEKQNGGVQNDGKVYLFGQTRTQRKIVQLNFSSNTIRSLSNRVRIPVPRIHYDPIQLMYEQTQEIFHLGVYGLSVLPPFNKMVALYLQPNIIFLCGGKDFDSYNIKNEAFYYTINDENKNMTTQKYKSSEENGRTELKSKYSANKFQKIAGMNVKRYGHMGIYNQKLKSILIFGGINDKQEIVNSCEKYGILDNTWRDIHSMHHPRANGNCFLFNNKVYLFGGKNSNTKKSKKIEVFHCETNHWEILNFKLHRGIEQSLIFSQRPNEIIIVGGKTYSESTKSVIKIDMVNQTLLWDSNLNYEYQSVKGIKTKSNIIIFGGKKDAFEIYENNTWIQKKFDNKKIIELDQIGLFSYSSHCQQVSYQPAEETKKKRNLENDLIIFGSDQYPCMVVCNLSSGLMTKQPISMRLKICSKMSIVEYEPGKYFLAGGCDWKQKKSFNSSYFYNSENNEFQQTVKMGQKKHSFAICSLNGFIYNFGGYDSLDKLAKKSCARFNLSNESWESLPTLRRARRNCHCLVINNDKIAIFGGVNVLQEVAGIEILNINDKKFDIYEPNLYLPRSIICTYIMKNNENSIYLINNKQSEGYELTTVSLVPNNINSNRSVVSSNLQTIDLNPLKQQRPQSNISQRNTQIIRIKQPSNVNNLVESKSINQSTDNLKTINIKPTFVEIKPKKLQSESSQINQLNKGQQNDLDQSFQMEKIDLNKYNMPKQTNELIEEYSKKQTIKQDQQLIIQKQQPIQVQSQIVQQKKEQAKPLEQVMEQIKLITSESIDWLKSQQYTLIDRIDRLYFLTHTQCIELHKNSGEVKSIKIQNCSNISLKMIK